MAIQELERLLARAEQAGKENENVRKELWEETKRLLEPYRKTLYSLFGVEGVYAPPHQLSFDGGRVYYTIWWGEGSQRQGSIRIPSLEALQTLLQKLTQLLEEKIKELSEETHQLRELLEKLKEVN
jgi:hypothetical protein